MPVATALLSSTRLRTVARRRLARLQITARARPREYSWGHAQVEWPDGTRREGWLQAGDASACTAAVAALVATRLAAGQGPPGAYTPAAAFGAGLAADAGGRFVLDGS